MALNQYQAPVDYAAQLDGFKDFLKHFKTLQSTSEAAATEALEDLNIDGNRTSDEYDFMDDVDEGAGARRRKEPKLKYMQILQDLANRDASNIVIELDDLEIVSLFGTRHPRLQLLTNLDYSSKELCPRNNRA
jgi:hypothetical protein